MSQKFRMAATTGGRAAAMSERRTASSSKITTGLEVLTACSQRRLWERALPIMPRVSRSGGRRSGRRFVERRPVDRREPRDLQRPQLVPFPEFGEPFRLPVEINDEALVGKRCPAGWCGHV